MSRPMWVLADGTELSPLVIGDRQAEVVGYRAACKCGWRSDISWPRPHGEAYWFEWRQVHLQHVIDQCLEIDEVARRVN